MSLNRLVFRIQGSRKGWVLPGMRQTRAELSQSFPCLVLESGILKPSQAPTNTFLSQACSRIFFLDMHIQGFLVFSIFLVYKDLEIK